MENLLDNCFACFVHNRLLEIVVAVCNCGPNNFKTFIMFIVNKNLKCYSQFGLAKSLFLPETAIAIIIIYVNYHQRIFNAKNVYVLAYENIV